MTWFWREDRTHFMVPLWHLNSSSHTLLTHWGRRHQARAVRGAERDLWWCVIVPLAQKGEVPIKTCLLLGPWAPGPPCIDPWVPYGHSFCDSRSWIMPVSSFSCEHRIWVSFPEELKAAQFVWMADCEFLGVWLLSPHPPAFVYPAVTHMAWVPNCCEPLWLWLQALGQRWPCPTSQEDRNASSVEQSFSASQKMRISEWCFVWSFHLKLGREEGEYGERREIHGEKEIQSKGGIKKDRNSSRRYPGCLVRRQKSRKIVQ